MQPADPKLLLKLVILTKKYLKCFHFQVKEKHQPIFPANDIIITSVIAFIKSLADVSNLDWIARQVFKSEKVDLAEITKKLNEAVEHYSSLPSEEPPAAPQSPGIAPGNKNSSII